VSTFPGEPQMTRFSGAMLTLLNKISDCAVSVRIPSSMNACSIVSQFGLHTFHEITFPISNRRLLRVTASSSTGIVGRGKSIATKLVSYNASIT
jgi:hypothetical protein